MGDSDQKIKMMKIGKIIFDFDALLDRRSFCVYIENAF